MNDILMWLMIRQIDSYVGPTCGHNGRSKSFDARASRPKDFLAAQRRGSAPQKATGSVCPTKRLFFGSSLVVLETTKNYLSLP